MKINYIIGIRSYGGLEQVMIYIPSDIETIQIFCNLPKEDKQILLDYLKKLLKTEDAD